EGRKDVHKALAIVGSEPSSDTITAHVIPTAGQYAIIASRAATVSYISTTPPGHGKLWKRARKILRPTAEGFEERLEVDNGDGSFVPYYVVRMRKVEHYR